MTTILWMQDGNSWFLVARSSVFFLIIIFPWFFYPLSFRMLKPGNGDDDWKALKVASVCPVLYLCSVCFFCFLFGCDEDRDEWSRTTVAPLIINWLFGYISESFNERWTQHWGGDKDCPAQDSRCQLKHGRSEASRLNVNPIRSTEFWNRISIIWKQNMWQ